MKLKNLISEAKLDFYQDKSKTNDVIDNIQSKFLPDEIMFSFYRIEFSYKTIRGNNKGNVKYDIAVDEDDAKFKFIEYINKFNRQYSFRPYLNVKILKCVEEGNMRVLIE